MILTRFHKILIAALAIQLVLAVIVLTRGDDSAALKEHPLLAGFDAAKVTRLRVTGSGDAAKTIDLVKQGTNWVMASGFDYPVEATKVTDVLTPIAKMAAAAPIATQASRHKQLKVADTEFERKLVITVDGKDLTLLLGGPAGARRNAVRIGGDDKVYAVAGVTPWSINTEPRPWVDASYVKIPTDQVAKVVVERDGRKLELARESPPAAAGTGSGAGSAAGSGAGSAAGSAAGSGAGSGAGSAASPPEHWTASIDGAPLKPGTGESLDEPTIDRLVGEAASIDLTSPGDPKRDAAKPTATITIERKPSAGSTPAPTLVDIVADGSSYWVHDRSLPRAVLVDKARLDELLGADRDKLIKKPPPPPPAAAAGAGSGKMRFELPPGALPPGALPPGMVPGNPHGTPPHPPAGGTPPG